MCGHLKSLRDCEKLWCLRVNVLNEGGILLGPLHGLPNHQGHCGHGLALLALALQGS